MDDICMHKFQYYQHIAMLLMTDADPAHKFNVAATYSTYLCSIFVRRV